MTYKIDNNTKIVNFNNEEFYPKLVNGILIELTEQECILEKNRREQALSPLKNVVAEGVPVAENWLNPTVLLLGVPILSVFPKTVI